MSVAPPRPRSIVIAAIVAILFGIATIVSGGTVLFTDSQFRTDAGNFVPFVVWFNFLAGFAYVAAGIGLLAWQHWGVRLSMLIALATLLVFAALDVHILLGGAYETRTLAAMTLRSIVWLLIAYLARRAWNRAAD